MSLNKNEVEYMRLHAQKCDHRIVAPGTSFDLAADLRAHKDRGGRMFVKRRERADKYVTDDNRSQWQEPRRESSLGPNLFAAHPVPWKAPPRTSGSSFGQLANKKLMDDINRNARENPSLWTTTQGEQEDTDDNLSDAERLHKLYRILGYSPPEAEQQNQPSKGPKTDLRARLNVAPVVGRNFNRNAKGWCAEDAVDGDPQGTVNPPSRPEHLPGLRMVDIGYYTMDYSPEARPEERPRPRSWHPVSMKDFDPQDEGLCGDYNPRPKAWQSAWEEGDSPQEVVPLGDYNPRPKAWTSGGAEDLSPSREVQFGDYNPRPKAWKSTQRKSKSAAPLGDYNPRPKAWQSSGREHRELDPKGARRQVEFGDYNPRPKAWQSPGSGKHGSHDRSRYGNFNPRPRGWRSPPEGDSSSTCSTYTESSDDDYSYGSSLYSPHRVPACDV